jgi:hypothetical protein
MCRLLANKNHGYKAMTHMDVATKSGIPLSTVAEISVRTTWAKVPLEIVSRFADACGVDLLMSEALLKRKLKRNKMAHVMRSKGRQKQFLVRLMTG